MCLMYLRNSYDSRTTLLDDPEYLAEKLAGSTLTYLCKKPEQ